MLMLFIALVGTRPIEETHERFPSPTSVFEGVTTPGEAPTATLRIDTAESARVHLSDVSVDSLVAPTACTLEGTPALTSQMLEVTPEMR